MEPDLETLFLSYRRDKNLEALAALFDRVAPHLLKVAHHLAPDGSAAEDLVQETFLVVLEDAQAFEEGRRLVPWLVGILVNRARILHRSLRRGLDEERLARSSPPGPEEQAQARELAARLDETLAQIGEPYREVLRLHLMEECAPAEVARLLGRPQSTVRTQLQRGLRLLRRLLPGGLLPGVAPLALRSLARIRKAVLAQASAGTALPPALVRAGAKKWLLACSGVVLLTGLGLFLASRLGDRAPDPPTAVPPLAGGNPGVPSARPGPPDPPGASPRKAVEPPADPTKRFHPQPADGWLVEVVRPLPETSAEGQRFEPVPFAELSFLDPLLVEDYHAYRSMIERWAGRRTEQNLPMDESYRALGRDYQADAEGRVRVPRPLDQGAFVCGWKEDLWGRVILPMDGTPPFRLVLYPDVRLRVQVVDGGGRPVPGVPVSLIAVTRLRANVTPPMWTEGPEGIAEFRRFGRLLEEEWALMRRQDHTLYAQLMIPLREPVVRAIDPARPMEDPLRMVLPPTGSVVVEAADPDGLPPGGRFLASLGARADVDLVDGTARFPHVGLGLDLTVEVWKTLPANMGFLSRGQKQTGPGPTLPGEEIRFSFPGDPCFPMLAGRVVDEANRPRAFQTLDYSYFFKGPGGERWTFPFRMRTDRDGCFLVPLHEEYRPGLQAVLFLATPGRALDGQVDLPGHMQPGRHEIGAVTLRATRLFCAGRVVDSRGQPLPMVAVAFFVPGAPESDSVNQSSPGIINPLVTNTDQEGRFSCRSSLALEKVSLRMRSPGYVPFERTVQAGLGDLELVLERAALLDGSLLLPEGASPEDFILLARNTDPPDRREHRTLLHPDGKFRFWYLASGEIAFQVRLRTGEIVHEEAGIKAEGGAITSDPRLQGIDLRGRFLLVMLDVVDASGAPVPTGRVYRPGVPDPIGEIARGKARLLVPPGGLDLEVACPGHRNLVVRAVGSSRKLVLEPDLPPLPGGGGEGDRTRDRSR